MMTNALVIVKSGIVPLSWNRKSNGVAALIAVVSLDFDDHFLISFLYNYPLQIMLLRAFSYRVIVNTAVRLLDTFGFATPLAIVSIVLFLLLLLFLSARTATLQKNIGKSRVVIAALRPIVTPMALGNDIKVH